MKESCSMIPCVHACEHACKDNRDVCGYNSRSCVNIRDRFGKTIFTYSDRLNWNMNTRTLTTKVVLHIYRPNTKDRAFWNTIINAPLLLASELPYGFDVWGILTYSANHPITGYRPRPSTRSLHPPLACLGVHFVVSEVRLYRVCLEVALPCVPWPDGGKGEYILVWIEQQFRIYLCWARGCSYLLGCTCVAAWNLPGYIRVVWYRC